MPTQQEMIDTLFAALDGGATMHEIMRAQETAAGAWVVKPGDVDWLPASEWHPTIVVSKAGRIVRLVALLATRPGTGAFRRLVVGIEAAGLVPCVVCPSVEMRATLKRWRWRQKIVGFGMDSEERWMPRRNPRTQSS